MRITIVEDEPKLAALLSDYLTQEDYQAEIYNDGQIALDAITANPPDLVLLDLMLPGLDGMSICRAIRKTSELPIIMITARVEEIDRLLGLEIGADDYICKPFSPREVVARVKAVLRRSNDSAVAENSEHFSLDEGSARVLAGDKVCELTAVELNLLKVMSQKPGQIFSRNQLMSRIYTDNRVVSDRTIDSHIKKLRQKLTHLGTSKEYIHSVYGIGYKFELLDI